MFQVLAVEKWTKSSIQPGGLYGLPFQYFRPKSLDPLLFRDAISVLHVTMLWQLVLIHNSLGKEKKYNMKILISLHHAKMVLGQIHIQLYIYILYNISVCINYK